MQDDCLLGSVSAASGINFRGYSSKTGTTICGPDQFLTINPPYFRVLPCPVLLRACFVLSGQVEVTVSRFKLHIRVLMSLLRDRNMVQFELDPDCTKAGRAVLREATGFFYVESPPDRPGFSRVWMLAKVDVNRFVPGAIVDYAAGRALPRASNWIKPTCEAAQRRKLRATTG